MQKFSVAGGSAPTPLRFAPRPPTWPSCCHFLTTCIFRLFHHFWLGALFSILSSSLLITCPYHLIHSPMPFYLACFSNPSAPPYSFYLPILLHTLTSPWLFPFFSKLPFHFPSCTMFHFHKMLPIFQKFDTPSLSFSKKNFFHVTTLRIL